MPRQPFFDLKNQRQKEGEFNTIKDSHDYIKTRIDRQVSGRECFKLFADELRICNEVVKKSNGVFDFGKAYDLFWIISGFCLVMSFLGIVVSGIFNTNNTYLILLVFLIVMQIVAELFSSAALAVYMVEFSRSQYLTLDLSAINLGGQLQNIVGPMIFGESAASNSLAPLSMCVLTLSFTVIELRRILSLCRKK